MGLYHQLAPVLTPGPNSSSELNVKDGLTSILWQLLQSQNDMVCWRLTPCVLWHQGRANLLKLLVVEDALWGVLDVDLVSGIKQCLGSGWGEGRTVLEWLACGLLDEFEVRV